MNQLKAYKGQLFFTAFLLFFILVMPFQDYTERTFPSDEMNYPEEQIGIVRTDNGILTVPEGAGEILLNSDELYFKKGSYETTFHVAAAQAGSTVEIVDPLYVNADNTTGRVLADAEVPSTGEAVKLSFTVEEYAQCIQFRVQSRGPLKFSGIYLLSQRGLYRDPWIYAGLLLLGSAFILAFRRRKKLCPEVLALLGFAALWSCLPILYNWLPKGHDMFFHYGRLFNLSEDLLSGQVPVRIHPRMYRTFSYISPVFYSEFFLYPLAVLGIWGLSPIGCYKLLIVGVNFATAGVAYYSFSRLCRSRHLGLIASLLYTLSMYRMINLYTRSAIGEVLATIFLPLLLLGMYQLFLGDSRKWLTAVIAFTALFQSHMITTELSIGFGILFGLICLGRLKDKQRLLHLILAGTSTILLNLWFILPFLDHMRYSVHALSDARNLSGYSLYPVQIFDVGVENAAGDALGRGSIVGEMPYSLGIVLLIGVLLFVLWLLGKGTKNSFHRKLGIWCLTLGGLSIYASSIYFPWERIQSIGSLGRLAGNIQFASRFLPFATLFLCLASAIGIYYFFQGKEQKKMLFLLCAVTAVYSTGSYFSKFCNQAEAFVSWDSQMDHSQDTDALYLISDNGAYFSVRKMGLQETGFLPSEGVCLTDCAKRGTSASFAYTKEAGSKAYVDVPFNYYPYYRAMDGEGMPLSTEHGDLLRLRVLLPGEMHSGTVTVNFELPGWYRIGDAISLAALCLLVALATLSYRKSRKMNQENA